MDLVPATGTVRRTVRMAVALVLGQALLCALIGWLTFGRSPAAPPTGGNATAVDRLAVPPLVPSLPPVASAGPAPSPPAAGRTAGPTARRKAAVASSTRFRPATPASPPAATVPPAPTPVEPDPPGTPTTVSAPAGSTLPAPSPPPAPVLPGFQQPVTIGDRCAPEWAFGSTEDGTLVQCRRSGPRHLRWKIA